MANFNIDYLVVAGGGAGGGCALGNFGGSGGGAGGVRTSFTPVSTPANYTILPTMVASTGTTYNITIGSGGIGVASASTKGGSGANSIFNTVTATGGGGGGVGGNDPGLTGGSAGGTAPTTTTRTNSVSPTQGFRGGGAGTGTNYGSGGGGGGGAQGAQGTNSKGGDGGIGFQTAITGTATYFAGGGGGGSYKPPSGATSEMGLGGLGGGGDALVRSVGEPGTDGLGGGGGAATNGDGEGGNRAGGNGGSGIVILRYATADANYTATGLTPTETTDGTDTILSFTTVGTGSITFATPVPPFSGTKISNELLDLNQQNNEIGLRIPVGNDTDQPAPSASNTGSIRYNTDTQGLSISDGTEFQKFDFSQSTLPTVTLTNSWRAWDTASFTNGGTTCTDVTGGLVLGPYSSGSPGAFFYGSFNNVAGNKYWVLNGGGSHGRRAGFTRPTEFTISYWGNKPSNPGYNSERAIWTFNTFGSENIRLARRNNAGTSSLRIYSGNSSIAAFADGITTNTWYNITLTFSLNTVKTYVGVQGSTNTTLINTTTLSSGNFPTGILNANGTGFWIGTNSGYTDWSTDSWSSLNIYDGVARQSEIDTIVSNGYQQ